MSMTPAQVTEAHRKLVTDLCRNATGSNRALHHVPKFAQLIADSEARAIDQSFVSHPVRLTLEAYSHDRAERDELRAEVKKLQEQIGQQLAACDCAAMMDTPETHEKNKTVTRENPFWSPAFESVMRRTAECIALRADVEKAKGYIALQVARAEKAEREVERLTRAYVRPDDIRAQLENALARAERAEAELAKERARLDWLLTTGVCWRGCDTEIPEEHWVVGPDTEWLYDRAKDGRGRARIDQAMKEDAP